MHTGFIDLHVHSNSSDGKYSVEEIFDMLHQNDVSVVSFTEHYNLGSYRLARMLASDDIEVIPGIEIGTSLEEFDLSNRHICHIAAYYPSYRVCKILDEYEINRDICVKKTLEKLRKQINISYSTVKKYARNINSVGRFDIAIALSKLGYVSDPISAYGEYLDFGKAYFVERKKQTPSELIRNIRSVHGVPVLVHPKSLKLNYESLFNLLLVLKKAGLEGIEVYNPHNTLEQREKFLLMAKELDLVTTVGSDFHGFNKHNVEIGLGISGNLRIDDYNIITEIKRRQHMIIDGE